MWSLDGAKYPLWGASVKRHTRWSKRPSPALQPRPCRISGWLLLNLGGFNKSFPLTTTFLTKFQVSTSICSKLTNVMPKVSGAEILHHPVDHYFLTVCWIFFLPTYVENQHETENLSTQGKSSHEHNFPRRDTQFDATPVTTIQEDNCRHVSAFLGQSSVQGSLLNLLLPSL